MKPFSNGARELVVLLTQRLYSFTFLDKKERFACMSIGPVLFPERLPNLVASGIVIIYSFTQGPYTDLFPIFWEATMEKSISLLKLIWVEIYDEVYSWEL